MPLLGVRTKAQQDPSQRSSFRNTWFQPEGTVAAHILEGVVADINLRNWTVDVLSKYDQRYFLNVQVSSPYMHFNNGEGIFCMPDIGAKCHVCIPSDGPPPFVLDFIMPMETIPQAGTDDAPQGTQGGQGDEGLEDTDATFAGGRTRPKPGDIYIKNRDGSFIVLHRGGVLQIGSTELAQRIYIPLQNLITDVSQNYRHHNTGGSINWFVNAGESEENPPTVWRHTYRLLANDAKGSLRVAIGKLSDVITETDSTIRSDLELLKIGTSEPLVCEVVLAPDGFVADSGDLDNTLKKTVLRYFFDKAGNAMLRTKGSVYLRVEKRMRVRVDDDFDILGKKNFRLEFEGTGRLQAGASLDISAGIVKFNGGSKAIATVGSQVNFTPFPPGLTFSVIIPPATSPVVATVLAGPLVTGVVASGNPTLLG